MARIPADEIQRLKQEIPIQSLVQARGIDLKPQGKDLVGRCPFHDDKTPSLILTPDKNLWHCMGACNQGGSVIDWVMKADGVSFRHAVEILQTGAGFKTDKLDTPPPQKKLARKLAPLTARDADDQKLLNDVVGFYHETLEKSPEALQYLQSRGLTSVEMIDYFQLGFANRTLGYRLPAKAVKAGREIRERLQNVGLLRDTGHEHFRGSITFPVFDEQGDVVAIYGRKINDHLKGNPPKHSNLKGPLRGVFNLPALQEHQEIILCESIIDALTFWCAGYRNVTAAYGVNGVTKDLLDAFKRNGTQRVLIGYDRDEAGRRATEELAEQLTDMGIACYRLLFPKGMDANTYACQVTPAKKSLGTVIRSAEYMSGAATAPPIPPEPEPDPIPVVEHPQEPFSIPLAANDGAVTTPEPPASRLEIDAEIKSEDEVIIRFGADKQGRHYRIRGLKKNMSTAQLRVNVLAARDSRFFVDTLDLYAARQRKSYCTEAAQELGLTDDQVRVDMGRVLLKLEELQEQNIEAAVRPAAAHVAVNDKDKAEAMTFLKSPNLLHEILTDFEIAGVVGEEVNKLVGYLAATSRMLDAPLAVIIQSSSAAGKTSLMEAILSLMPKEETVKFSAMTGQSLYYMGDQDLKHKILALVEEEGAQRASYSLKLLQSEKELNIATTVKDPESGDHKTKTYTVEGPVMIFFTTTAMEIDEELQNRAIVLTVDEDREQTRRIHEAQRKAQTLAGLMAQVEKNRIEQKHRNAQRLLRPLHVVNPYAEELTFLDTRTRTRRDHMKYLALIRAVALLHQHQRPIKTIDHRGELLEYVEVSRRDIAVANQLAHATLGRSLDELSPQTRNMLLKLNTYVTEQCGPKAIERSEFRFTRRSVRQHIGWSDFQVRMHLQKLVDLEYVLVHRGSRGQQFVYELLYDGQGKDGSPFLVGLQDIQQYDLNFEVLAHHCEPPTSVQRASIEDGVSSAQNGSKPNAVGALAASTPPNGGNTYIGSSA